MHVAGEVLWSFESALDKGFVDDHLAVRSVSSHLCQASTCFRIGSKFRCMRSTPTEMQSMRENDFEWFGQHRSEVPGECHVQSTRAGDTHRSLPERPTRTIFGRLTRTVRPCPLTRLQSHLRHPRPLET